ncbi:MAG: NAD(P)-binding domain-containing protein [Nostoc sp.]|nr:NAD(P)-binding domain-containing protein [Nostoc sp. ChiQUE02]MDZ8233520.1 NAD(P)-binding domain-containing protein [Nostoc sp. ChiQUE02]
MCSSSANNVYVMELGMIGLGRMGANMARRLTQAGHTVVGYTRQADKAEALVKEGAIARGVTSFVDLVDVLLKDPKLSNFEGRVSDSGEGRWTLIAAIEEAVPVPVLSSALQARFSSRGQADFADKLLSALRYEFGGHLEQ